MFKRSSIVLLLTIGMVFPACRKDHPDGVEAPTCDCIPTPPTPMQGWNFQVPEHVVNGPRFNPNDGDEFIFMERPHGSQTEFNLRRYRISTGLMSQVLTGDNLVNMSFPADWGSNGWILLNLTSSQGQNIFKVKATGDSLSQLTFSSSNFSPIWSPSCTHYGYNYTGVPGGQVLVDAHSGNSDTLLSVPLNGTSCWFEQDLVASVGFSGVFIDDLVTDQTIQVCAMPSDLYDFAAPTGIAMLPGDQTILWMHTGGLYRTDRASGSTEQLFCTCNSQYFVGLDYSPQTNKLLTTRITRTPMNDQDLLIETDIVLMNPDGTGQQVLNLPFPE